MAMQNYRGQLSKLVTDWYPRWAFPCTMLLKFGGVIEYIEGDKELFNDCGWEENASNFGLVDNSTVAK